MKIKILYIVIIFLVIVSYSYGQTIFENNINDINPNAFNPYTNGQLVDANIIVSGIGRGAGINGNTANDRYNARDWFSGSLDTNDYFEFSLTPNTGYKIDFLSLVYKAQVSTQGPVNFALRSSVDGFAADITLPVITNSGSEVTPLTIDLSAAEFQNCTGTITFRFYAWGATATTGTFSINEFAFNGAVTCDASTPEIGTVVQPKCTMTTGSIELTGLPATGSWDLYQNNVLIVDDGVGDSFNVQGLTVGSYSYTLSNGYCVSPVSVVVSLQPLATTWDGSLWSNGIPTTEYDIIFNGNYSSTTDLSGCSCRVNSGAITINSDHTLRLDNEVVVVGGSLLFENNASLVQINNAAANSGSITYKRMTTPILKTDYTYWSSPVADFTLGGITSGTLYYSFNAAANSWAWAPSVTKMDVGKGYIVRGPSNYSTTSPATFLATFTGVPNNGMASVPIASTATFNLIGNPYPSAIDADAFITANTGIIDGTLYFWTHNTPIANNVYASDDYAVYNLSGGVGTRASVFSGVNNTIPDGKIAAGQSFFVTSVNGGGTAVFNNSMRVIGNNTSFFKLESIKKQNNRPQKKNRIWLSLSNSKGAFKQTLIGYIDGATNDYDTGFDGESYGGNKYLNFYSIHQDKNFAIQGRALPFKKTDAVRLGYSTTIEGVFTINIDAVDGLFSNEEVFIEDQLNDVIFDLKSGSYTFDTKSGVFDDRFVLRYTDRDLVPAVVERTEDYIRIINRNKQIKITSDQGKMDKITIYDLSGKKIYQRNNVDAIALSVSNLVAHQEVLLIKVVLVDGQTFIRKTLY